MLGNLHMLGSGFLSPFRSGLSSCSLTGKEWASKGWELFGQEGGDPGGSALAIKS